MKAMILDRITDLRTNATPLRQADLPIQPEVKLFDLEDANTALMELKTGAIRGAKVLTIKH